MREQNYHGGTNIDIGNAGISTDTNIIRIGSGQTKTFVAGIRGADTGSGSLVFINSSGQLGTVSDTPIVASSAATADNFSGSLSGDVTGSQSGTVVASVGGQTAASVASGVIAANAATDANTVSSIVKRNSSGNFSAGSVTLGGVLNLPTTTATAGIVNLGGPGCCTPTERETAS